MPKVFSARLEALQPARLHLSAAKLECFGAWLGGVTRVQAVWDEDDLDWEAYAICVGWCKAEGVRAVAGLANRVIDARSYERLWLDRCRVGGSSRSARCMPGDGPVALTRPSTHPDGGLPGHSRSWHPPRQLADAQNPGAHAASIRPIQKLLCTICK